MNEIPLFKVLMSPTAGFAVSNALYSGHIAQGPAVDRFESELARVLQAPASRIVTVNSGTSALHLAYILAGLERGSAAIVSPMTCSATITPLVQMGVEIIWADVDPITGNIDPASVERVMDRSLAIYCGIGAVVAIDWAGTPAPYDILRDVIPMSIPIIEDAAHAFGAERLGAPIAELAAEDNIFACYSFQAIKHLTTGDGGALVTPTDKQADRARRLRWFGLDRKSKADFRCEQDIAEAGFKYHMNDIAATIGLDNLRGAIGAVAAHRDHAARYYAELSDLGPRVVCPPPNPESAWWIYTLLVDDRPSFQAYLAARGIQTSQVHRRNDHHTAFPRSRPGELPGLDAFSARQVSIPVGWWLTSLELERVTEAVRGWARS